MDSSLNHLTVVVNGQQLEDKAFPIPVGALPTPTNLAGKLALFKMHIGFFYQAKHRVSNLNIFSRKMSLSEMASRTAGDDCRKANGDYLAWESSNWTLHGEARYDDVAEDHLCRRGSRIQVFTAPVAGMEQCQNICEKINKGTVASGGTLNEMQEGFDRINKVLTKDGKPTVAGKIAAATWFPIRQTENGSWVDLYTDRPKNELKWATGQPTAAPCAVWVIPYDGLLSYPCSADPKNSPLYCPCQFPVTPKLRFRGLCPDSHIDQVFIPRNDPVTGYLYFYGNRKTTATFDGEKWEMLTAFFNTSASTGAAPESFILGKHSWRISGDSEKCHSGKPYTMKLKLTGCLDEDFTCDDGQCIKMVERCNQVPDCRDESDENGCQLIVFKNNYNKNIPPIGRTAGGGSVPAEVKISINLMKVVEIEERDHSIHLQFEINLQWREDRVKYQNLKDEVSLNALSERDIRTLWLPRIEYANTDQKDTTRLGMEWEWVTQVSVLKEGDFTRSGLQEVDEAEIFKGDQNTLTMI